MKKVKISSVEDAVRQFEESAVAQSNAQNVGDSRTYNKHYHVKTECIVYLHEHQQLKALQKLLSHSNVHVRNSAAYALLPVCPKESENVLEEIDRGNYELESFDAGMTLRMWRAGELVFPYHPEYGKKKTKAAKPVDTKVEIVSNTKPSPQVLRLSRIFGHEPHNANEIRNEEDDIYIMCDPVKKEITIRMNTFVNPYVEDVEQVFAARVERLKVYEPTVSIEQRGPSKLGFMQVVMTISEPSATDDLLKRLKDTIYQIHATEQSHKQPVCYKAAYEGNICYFENLWWYTTRAVIKKRGGYERYDFSDEQKFDEEMWEMEVGAIDDHEQSDSFELITPAAFQEMWDQTTRKHLTLKSVNH